MNKEQATAALQEAATKTTCQYVEVKSEALAIAFAGVAEEPAYGLGVGGANTSTKTLAVEREQLLEALEQLAPEPIDEPTELEPTHEDTQLS